MYHIPTHAINPNPKLTKIGEKNCWRTLIATLKHAVANGILLQTAHAYLISQFERTKVNIPLHVSFDLHFQNTYQTRNAANKSRRTPPPIDPAMNAMTAITTIAIGAKTRID